MTKHRAVAYTMQALVKYHGMKNPALRIPFHDSISVNTTCMMTEATVSDEARGGVFIEGKTSDSANARLDTVMASISHGSRSADFRFDSRNVPKGRPKGIGYSSSAGAVLTLLAHRMLAGDTPDLRDLSRKARLFAASASRSLVGGFSRLYAGDDDHSTFAERFADSSTMDLRMVVVPLPSNVRTEDAHREVLTSPFFEARVKSAQKRCDEMEAAIMGNDLERLGTLAEKDTMELHALTMTGENRLIIMNEDSIRIIRKVRELRSGGADAYFSLQTGPSVFINTSEKDQSRVHRAISRLGYTAYLSGVGGEAHILEASND
ncbi:MAG TPA: hypothetical protein VEJ36_03240 [Nitrososphaerales archaeon]|nr:hypothetical protein [Nitrososphaerales archaeon]